MAKVRIKGVDKVLKNIRKTFEEVSTSKKLLSQIGNFTVDRIKSFARSGKTIAQGRPKSLPRLSESYIQQRMGAVKFRTIDGRVIPFPEPDERLKNVDPEFFDPNRKISNLTFSGQLMRSLIARIERDELFIELKESRDDGIKNSKIVEFLKKLDSDYDFIGLDDKGKERVRRFVLDEVRRQIKKLK